MPKVSVIVPVYGVEKYIERCARSLFEQTLDRIELLFVNDCTPDNSVEIIERVIEEYRSCFAEKESVARIITMSSNTGLAGVRRQGIIVATGDFIIHCDGDDWVDVDLYEKMYNEAVYSGADIVMCGSIYEYVRCSNKKEAELPTENGRELVRNLYRKCLGMHCWNKLVRRSLYVDNDILPWVGLNMWEDNGLMTRLFYYAGKLSVVRDSYYHYNRANLGSMTNGYGQKAVKQMIGVAEHLTDFFESKPDSDDFRKTIMAFQFLAKINLITDSFSRIKEYHTVFPRAETIASELDPGAFSAKGRFRSIMVKCHLTCLFVLMFKVKNLFSLHYS